MLVWSSQTYSSTHLCLTHFPSVDSVITCNPDSAAAGEVRPQGEFVVFMSPKRRGGGFPTHALADIAESSVYSHYLFLDVHIAGFAIESF